ncbi:MAG: glycosyltransferase [Pseudomonadota bacterium]
MVCYQHDDPWGPLYKGTWRRRRFWKYYIAGIPHFDLHFLKKRPLDYDEIVRCGAKRVERVWLYFVPSLHRPVKLNEEELESYACDVVFVGHYEPDGRWECLRALVKAGLRVRLFGGGNTWNRRISGDLTPYFGSIRPAMGDDYAKALCGARMCLCFLSRLNRDTFTRRCFEIPACGRLLLCERTPDLQALFKEDEEAVFFSSKDELVEKALWLHEHPDDAQIIARAGSRRVHEDGHSVDDRMREFLKIIGN